MKDCKPAHVVPLSQDAYAGQETNGTRTVLGDVVGPFSISQDPNPKE